MSAPVNSEITEAIVNAETLADLLGISARRVRDLAKEKIIRPKSQKPLRFVLNQAIPAYLAYKNQSGNESSSDYEIRKEKAEAEIKENRAIKEKLITQTLQGKMHDARDVQSFTSELVLAFRQEALALPNKLAIPTAKSNDPAVTHSLIKSAVNQLLLELAEYDYEKEAYIREARKRIAIDTEQEIEYLD